MWACTKGNPCSQIGVSTLHYTAMLAGTELVGMRDLDQEGCCMLNNVQAKCTCIAVSTYDIIHDFRC